MTTESAVCDYPDGSDPETGIDLARTHDTCSCHATRRVSSDIEVWRLVRQHTLATNPTTARPHSAPSPIMPISHQHNPR